MNPAQALPTEARNLASVILGLDPRIHTHRDRCILGSSPRMTSRVLRVSLPISSQDEPRPRISSLKNQATETGTSVEVRIAWL